MSGLTRRNVILSGSAMAGLAACGNGVGNQGAARLDARVDATRDYLMANFPNAANLAPKAAGILVMPVVTEAGFGFGGAYGRGALRVGGVTVDYYSIAKASGGFQIGAQQYAHALFFMTEEALMTFRRSPGWAAGADIEYAIPEGGGALAAETTTSLAPVIAVVFGQAGLRVGATLEGVKYTRIIP